MRCSRLSKEEMRSEKYGLLRMAVKGRQQMRLPRFDGRDASRNRKHSTSGNELLKREIIEEGTDSDYREYLLTIRHNARKRKLLGIRDRKRKRNTKTKSSGKWKEGDGDLENIIYHDGDCYYYDDDEEEEEEEEDDYHDEQEEEEEDNDDDEEEEKNDEDEEDEEMEEEEEEVEKADPDFLMILAGMKEDGNSYIFERVENGDRTIIKYEEPLSSDTESDELRRELGSAQSPHVNQVMPDSHHTPSKKLKRLAWSQMGSKFKSKREEKGNILTKKNVPVPGFTPLRHTLDSSSEEESDAELRRTRAVTKQSKETKKLIRSGPMKKSKIEKEEDIIQMDPDYYVFSKHCKAVDGNYVFNDGNHEVVYEVTIRQRGTVKEEREDVSYSDVEMDKGCNPNQWDSMGKSEFWREIMAALRKPFDKEELERLYRQVKHYAAKERHLDLRNGREKAIGTQEDGKSLLDYHSGFRKKLEEAKGDNRKRLNLLRGFFLWIKKPEPPFEPWGDAECLAVYPEPGSDYEDF